METVKFTIHVQSEAEINEMVRKVMVGYTDGTFNWAEWSVDLWSESIVEHLGSGVVSLWEVDVTCYREDEDANLQSDQT